MYDNQMMMAPQPFSATRILFNPFYYLAGGPALGLGLAILLLTGLLGYFANSHVDGVLDFHTGRAAALWVFLAEGIGNWLIFSVLLFIAGKILSSSQNLRALDVFGTQALARAPYLLLGLLALLPGYQRRVAEIAAYLQTNSGASLLQATTAQASDMLVFLLVTIAGLLMAVWMIALMYRAYSSSCNLKGTKAIASFIVALIIAEVLSKIGISMLFVLERNLAG